MFDYKTKTERPKKEHQVKMSFTTQEMQVIDALQVGLNLESRQDVILFALNNLKENG